MKFANLDGRAAAITPTGAVDLAATSAGALPHDPMAYIDRANQKRAAEFVQSYAGVPQRFSRDMVRPPVPRPPKILAVALNYREHVQETGREEPQEPAVFAKLTSSLAGPYDSIMLPPGCSMIDYEAEVVVVIGRRMNGVDANDAWSYVSGITGGQDITDRREQRRPPSQFSLAKSYDTFSPIGPYLATPDEFDNLDDIGITGSIDGAEVQRGTTAQLIYSIPHLLAWTCRHVTLEPGDLVFTGTPGGIGSRREPPLYLAPGMCLETEIAHVGVMRNPVEAGPRSRPSPPNAGTSRTETVT